MSSQVAEGQISERVRKSKNSFLILGILFVLGGILSIAMPVISTMATSLTIGLLMAVCGVGQIVHAFQTQGWRGFFWYLIIGLILLIGGGMIYFDPLAGAVALTMVIAAVLIARGLGETALAFTVRPLDGWGWLLVAGLVAIVAGVLIAMNLPVAGISVPGTLVGVSLLFIGSAYIAISMAAGRVVNAIKNA